MSLPLFALNGHAPVTPIAPDPSPLKLAVEYLVEAMAALEEACCLPGLRPWERDQIADVKKRLGQACLTLELRARGQPDRKPAP
jgi:hypothetical protein